MRYSLLEFDLELFESDKLGKHDWMRAVDNRRYVEGLDKNYGFKPPAGTDRSMRASKIIGRDVDSRTGKDIGKIKDLVTAATRMT